MQFFETVDPRDSLKPEREMERGEALRSAHERPRNVLVVTLNLTTERTEGNPFRIPFPFKTVFARDTSGDTSANVDLMLHSNDAAAYANRVNLKLNDSFSLPTVVAEGYLTWSAQSGKTITLYFAIEGEFRSGQQLSLTAGGTSITDGSTFSVAAATLAAATAGAIVAQDTSRKAATFVNESGADLWIGGASVSNTGANKGVLVAAGEKVVWRNTAALYGYSVAGTTLTVMSEE